MSILTSILADLLQAAPELRPQLYFKSSLTALSHAMEDQVLAGLEQPLVIASFQRERFYRQEAHRYRRIAARTPQVYVLAAPETDFKSSSDVYESVAFDPTDGLSKEWHLVVLSPHSSTCLICREKFAPAPDNTAVSEMDPSRRFEGIWTFDRKVASIAAELLLNRIWAYRPELADKIQQAKNVYGLTHLSQPTESLGATSKKKGNKQGKKQISSQNLTLNHQDAHSLNADPFVQRLVTYLQAGQYKLIKAYRSIASQEQKERLVNSITAAIRRSLNPDEIMQVAVQELGLTIHTSRCLIYYCKATDSNAIITHEYLNVADNLDSQNVSILGQIWTLQNNPLFQEILQRREPVYVTDTYTDPRLSNSPIQALVQQLAIRSWLMVPVLYQDRLLGMVELHDSGPTEHCWKQYELELVEAIATQIGVALIQAEAYANLEDLNQQLEALDRTRANLVAITGHELRTPLSTIQVCLESLATEPDMSLELRQVMLNTALADTERMRKLIQDFLTLSRLESGRVEWHPEPLSLNECIELAISSIHARNLNNDLPEISSQIPPDLPLVRADGEWLVEVLVKLLDNACKFTPPQGNVTIKADSNGNLLKVTVTDTGRGIEPNRLQVVFDRFYQEEGALRRTTGGTGLGLAICRQIVNNWGGEIWAESEGKDQGSAFHFTIPMISSRSEPRRSGNPGKG
ncbi:MAG TPA: DICT sensory domain-containing protein [Oculatellaceae cyanobacterium]|jgi:DICT domain-containing protein/nitrogen-specific signal transduction histidine kinase